MDTEDEPDFFVQNSGVWSGQRLDSAGLLVEAFAWNLSLTPNTPYPSAFGATSKVTGRTCTSHPTTQAVHLKELMCFENADEPLIKYDGYLSKVQQGVVTITGVWTDTKSNTRGKFVAMREPDCDDVHISGIWVGEAAPAAELAEFFIPTNPIRWSLTIDLQNSLVYGCGYFDDSGDVPDQPVLFYGLWGSYNASEKKIDLVKLYEYSAFTKDMDVSYCGVLEMVPGPGSQKSFQLNGTWKNEKGACYGQFFCRQQPSSTSSHICICDVCDDAIKPGQTRWNCTACATSWNCCATCQSREEARNHPHPLIPETVCLRELYVLNQKMHSVSIAKGDTTTEVVLNSFKKFATRNFVGVREANSHRMNWLTYGDIYEYVLDIKHEISRYSKSGESRSFMLLMAELSPSYLSVMLAGLLHGFVIVPIHAEIEEEGLKSIITKTSPTVIVVSKKVSVPVAKVLEELQCASNDEEDRLMVVMQGNEIWPSKEDEFTYAEIPPVSGVVVKPLKRILEESSLLSKKEKETNFRKLKSDEIAAILYTSGSTGLPKGAIFTEELILPSEGIAVLYPFVRLDFQEFDPSFLLSLLSTMQCGGSRALATDLVTLLDDIEVARPTHIGATPIFWNYLFQEFQQSVFKKSRSYMGSGIPKTSEEIENEAAKELRAKLGNRLHVASCGGAPVSQQVIDFARKQLKIDIVNLYGSRETGGISRDGRIYGGLDVQLLSIPDLNYFADGDPPRGEICVCSPRLIPGYWKDEENTKNSFIKIGEKTYYRTGDVGEIQTQGTSKFVKIIDRAKFFLKLAQGEWISPSRIETVLEQSPWIKQTLIMASPTQSCCVAVVVPSELAYEFYGKPNKDSEKEEEEAFTQKMIEEIRFWCCHNSLRPIEVPKAVHVEHTPWDLSSEYFTATEKKRRHIFNRHYEAICKSLYETLLNNSKYSDISGVPSPSGSDLQFKALLRSVLPPGLFFSDQSTFSELGADSLMAVRFINLLKSEMHVELKIETLYRYSLGHIEKMIESQKKGLVIESVMKDVINWGDEWRLPVELEKIFNQEIKQTTNGEVFLTGCTGFLGPMIISEILHQFSPLTNIYCLARGKSDEDAKNRVIEDMKAADLWEDGFQKRIIVLAGKLEYPNFGLSDEKYERLKDHVTCIIHNGAHVNMTLPYLALKPVNVGGTIEVIKLCLQTKWQSRLHHVSSVAALPAGVHERENFVLCNSLDMESKEGYGQTKVVAERLVYEAQKKFGIDVRIYRPCSISGSSVNGFSNRRDFTNILLRAVIDLGAYPKNATLMLNWVPVNFVAKAIVAVAANADNIDVKVFHLTGDGGPAISDVLRVLCEIHYNIEEVPLKDWIKLLNNLPEDHPAFPVKHLMAQSTWSQQGHSPVLPKTQSEHVMRQLGVDWDRVDAEVIKRSVDYFRRSKFFPPPAEK